MARPVIGIAACSKLPDYEASVRRAGADVRVIDRTRPPADVIASIDGLVLTGGGDVEPALYGETPHQTFSPAEAQRDEYEMELVRLAMNADLPVLAICRGLQVLNVARGGTLVQDIPEQLHTAVNHRVPTPRDSIAHTVVIQHGTLLAHLMREHVGAAGTCPVNSRHHQAPRKVGEGLVVSATAPDGVIEALEDPSRPFLIGVQWHPENFWRTGEFGALFDGLVQHCRI